MDVSTLLYQLSELEYAVMNSLADGQEPLSLLLREMLEGTLRHPAAAVVSTLDGLMAKGLARCARTPHGLTFVNPTAETLLGQLNQSPGHGERDYWFELTEAGQTIWESWRQLHPR